jgi:hypothetical protein
MNQIPQRSPASALLRAAMLYAAGAFAVGFVLGTIRTLWVAPQLGPLVAVCIEAPFMIVASWLVYKQVHRLLRLNIGWAFAVLLGLRAFLYLQFFEIALFVFVFKRPLGDYAASLKSPEGMVGLAAQCVFALVPLLQQLRFRSQSKLG